jgi:uncharacterized protein
VKVVFTLRNDLVASEPTTVVDIVSDAELGGVLADFARTGGVAVAKIIMADFARRAAEEFARDAAPVGAAPEPLPEPVPLGAGSVLWAVIKAELVRLGRWLRLVR